MWSNIDTFHLSANMRTHLGGNGSNFLLSYYIFCDGRLMNQNGLITVDSELKSTVRSTDELVGRIYLNVKYLFQKKLQLYMWTSYRVSEDCISRWNKWCYFGKITQQTENLQICWYCHKFGSYSSQSTKILNYSNPHDFHQTVLNWKFALHKLQYYYAI